MLIILDILPEDSRPESKYTLRKISSLNRRYSSLSFETLDEANTYIELHSEYEIFNESDGFINLVRRDDEGIEIEFIPYEFKKYIEEPIKDNRYIPKGKIQFVHKDFLDL